jgi:hypothetical protein
MKSTNFKKVLFATVRTSIVLDINLTQIEIYFPTTETLNLEVNRIKQRMAQVLKTRTELLMKLNSSFDRDQP